MAIQIDSGELDVDLAVRRELVCPDRETVTGALLLFSQVVLSVQLSFAVIPLFQFTSDKKKMGPFVNGLVTKTVGWTIATLIAVLNSYLVYTTLFPAPAHK